MGGIRDRVVAAWQRRLRQIRERAAAGWHRGDLVRLGQSFETDKWGAHWYLQHYERHFRPLRHKRINLLEIGVHKGNSLRMWKAYFPKANIYGLDIDDKREVQEHRIKIFQGDQGDTAFLHSVVEQIGAIDIVIDDGSHINPHVIASFETLFPSIRNPGIYVIEDTQTSYWPSYGGSSRDINSATTTMGYFTRLIHCLNHEEILEEDRSPTAFDQHIVAMHFYHNLIVIHKGQNLEGSNEFARYGNDPRIRVQGPPGPLTTGTRGL